MDLLAQMKNYQDEPPVDRQHAIVTLASYGVLSTVAIMETIGCSRAYVRAALRQHGIPMSLSKARFKRQHIGTLWLWRQQYRLGFIPLPELTEPVLKDVSPGLIHALTEIPMRYLR